MDLIDKGILNDLSTNCRITFRRLAEKYGISSSAIKKRVKKLEETGIIHSYEVTLSPKMVGTDFLFGMLSTDGSQDEETFVNELGKNDKIIAAASYTGGHYALIAEFRDSQDLWEVGTFLRSFGCVHNIETHQLLSHTGEFMELSNLQLRVLNVLIDNPRMSIVDVAERTGLTARRARKLIKELVESQAVIFRAFLELGVAGSLPFLMQLTWDERSSDHHAIVSWLEKIFTLSLWETYISAKTPVMICLLTAENLTEVDAIARTARRHEHIPTVTVQIAKHHQYFPGIRQRSLLQTLEKAGLR